jgi:ABC-type nitrate/sulfonate/bicarbonate transport system ATPase subunit
MQDHPLDFVGSGLPKVIPITHDIEEATVLSDRSLVLGGAPRCVRRDVAVDLPKPWKPTSRVSAQLKEMPPGESVFRCPGWIDPPPLQRVRAQSLAA